MHCPFCQHEDTRVIDSRLADDGGSVRRRRECPSCGDRFNTFETAELKLPTIIKSGDRRQLFDEHKLRTSFERALQKRPVAGEDLDAAVRAVAHELRKTSDSEIPSRKVGELVMAQLERLDQVAYVRFASVYRRFQDVHAFREEVERLERDLPALDDKQMPLLGDDDPGSTSP